MAFSTGQLAVTSTAAQVVTPDADGCRVILHCIGNAQVFLGGASVTATTETLSYMILENA